jgi:hypothetical protein
MKPHPRVVAILGWTLTALATGILTAAIYWGN